MMSDANNTQPKKNIWQEILKQANTQKDLEESHLFIFGDKNTGKKSIIKGINKELCLNKENEDRTQLSSDDNNSKFALVDGKFLKIKKVNDTDNEILGKMHVWLINSFLTKDIFDTVFKPEFLSKTACMIVVDLSRPWEIIDTLKKWCSYIYDNFSRLMLKFPLDKQNEMRKNVEEYLKLYEEVLLDEDQNPKLPEKPSEETTNLKLEMPLKEGLLKVNIGVPIIIVVNKSEIVNQTGERKKFEEDSEFIQKHIRQFALNCK